MNAVIGITGSRSVHGCPDYPPNLSHLRADVFEVDYSIAVAAVGGVPVLLTRESDPASVVARVDGLLIAGGSTSIRGAMGRCPALGRPCWTLAVTSSSRL
jgi:gamma-glutamyl-gamma-aminobutyrate hydrolase PuuD